MKLWTKSEWKEQEGSGKNVHNHMERMKNDIATKWNNLFIVLLALHKWNTHIPTIEEGKLINLCSVRRDSVWRMKEQEKNVMRNHFKKKKKKEKQFVRPCFFSLFSKRRTPGRKCGQNEHSNHGIPVRSNYLFWLSIFFSHASILFHSVSFSSFFSLLSSLLLCRLHIPTACTQANFRCPLCHYCRDTPLIPLNCLLTFGVKSLIKFFAPFVQFICLPSCTPHAFCAHFFCLFVCSFTWFFFCCCAAHTADKWIKKQGSNLIKNKQWMWSRLLLLEIVAFSCGKSK